LIKTKVAFLEGRLLSSQSEQIVKFSKTSDWLEKAGPPKKPRLFLNRKYIHLSSMYRLKLWENLDKTLESG